MNKLCKKIKILISNIVSYIGGVLVGRTEKVVLIGAWMGSKFADNSRYLFQYLHEHKNELNIDDVIWATRNPDVDKQLKSLGYQSCLIGSKESKYWHLKAGIHILCNNAFPLPKYETDLDTKYSFGAKKVQLWHGVGFKSVGFSSNDAKAKQTRLFTKRILQHSIFSILQHYGGWMEAKVVATSAINADSLIKVIGCRKDRIIITGYPRNCDCPRLFEKEKRIIDIIKSYRGAILYLPTFRSDTSHYRHPLIDRKIVEYLNQNHILWVEKPHSADTNFTYNDYGTNNVLSLESNFDVNVLYAYLSVVISDYSSAVFDGIHKNIPVVMYTPDLDDFKNGDVGFLFDIEDYCRGLLAYDTEVCLELIKDAISGKYFNDQRHKVYKAVKTDFFNNVTPSIETIWSDLLIK